MISQTFITAALLGAAHAVKMGTQTTSGWAAWLKKSKNEKCALPADGTVVYGAYEAWDVGTERPGSMDNQNIEFTFNNWSSTDLDYYWIMSPAYSNGYGYETDWLRRGDYQESWPYSEGMVHSAYKFMKRNKEEVCTFKVNEARKGEKLYFNVDENLNCFASNEESSRLCATVYDKNDSRLKADEKGNMFVGHFVNQSDYHISHTRVTQDGSEAASSYIRMSPHYSREQNANVNYPWVIRNEDWYSDFVCAFKVLEAEVGEYFYFVIHDDLHCSVEKEHPDCVPQAKGTTVLVDTYPTSVPKAKPEMYNVTFDNQSYLDVEYYTIDSSYYSHHLKSSSGKDTVDYFDLQVGQYVYAYHDGIEDGKELFCNFIVDEIVDPEPHRTHFFFTIDASQNCFISREKSRYFCD